MPVSDLLKIGTASVVMLVIYAAFASIVAIQARRRGYNYWLWLLACMLGNMVFFLVLLVVMPHRRRLTLRRQFAAELDAKLADLERPRQGTTVPHTPPGDLTVGDLPTSDPLDRSLGDEVTRRDGFGLPPENPS